MKVIMMGPDRNYQGGMSAVINNYYNSTLPEKVKLYYIASAYKRSRAMKLIHALKAYLILIFMLIFLHIDIVHIHMASRGSFYRKRIALLICKWFNTKTILHLHSGEFHIFYENESTQQQKKQIKEALDSADAIIVLADSWKEIINRITRTRIIVLNNAVPVSDRNIYNPYSKQVVFMGNLTEKKGVYDILKAIPQIVEYDPLICFVLCGSGELEEVKSRIALYNIGHYVKLPGWLKGKDKSELFKDTLLFILPSYYEGMPMSVLEAMACGIPVVAANAGGVPQLIEDGKDGLLIQPGDINGLSKSIIRLASDESLRKTLSINAYSKILSKYEIEMNINFLIEFYKSLLER